MATSPTIAPNDPRLQQCGFAKLQGEGIEHVMRKYEITLGRVSKSKVRWADAGSPQLLLLL